MALLGGITGNANPNCDHGQAGAAAAAAKATARAAGGSKKEVLEAASEAHVATSATKHDNMMAMEVAFYYSQRGDEWGGKFVHARGSGTGTRSRWTTLSEPEDVRKNKKAANPSAWRALGSERKVSALRVFECTAREFLSNCGFCSAARILRRQARWPPELHQGIRC